MKATELNAQVQPTNLRTIYAKVTAAAASDERRQLELEYQDWARLQARGRHTPCGMAGAVDTNSAWDAQEPDRGLMLIL